VRWWYDTEATRSRWRSARQAVSSKGFLYLARLAVLWLSSPLWRLYFQLRPRTFTFQSARYTYFLHGYNLTWCNERAVEIPIVRQAVVGAPGARLLEVGNVLSHYFAADHEVLDKFEKGPSIRNEDVISFRQAQRYDLIVSISTLEHVGWDEAPLDPTKIVQAIDNLSAHLAPGGRLLVTLPLGYNPPMDAQIAAGTLPFSRCHYLKRTGFLRWQESDWAGVAGSPYAERWPGARGLVIGVVER
jgi:SAM-dependent methyltransferase